MNTIAHISIKNNIQQISDILDFCTSFCKKNEIDLNIVNRMNIILDELVSNIIKYSFTDNQVHKITLSFEKTEKYLAIKIIYGGAEFDPTKATYVPLEKDIEQMHIGGQGLKIVRKMTDVFEYKRSGEMNLISVKKKLYAN